MKRQNRTRKVMYIMKFSLFENNKSTFWDEVILAVITLLFLVGGIALVVKRPSFYFVSSSMLTMFGVIMIIAAFIYIICIAYRLGTNDKKVK